MAKCKLKNYLLSVPIATIILLFILTPILANAQTTVKPTEAPQTLAWKTSKQKQAAWAVLAIVVLFSLLAVAVWRSGICVQVEDFRNHYSRRGGTSEPMTIGKLLRSMANTNANAAQYSRIGQNDDEIESDNF